MNRSISKFYFLFFAAAIVMLGAITSCNSDSDSVTPEVVALDSGVFFVTFAGSPVTNVFGSYFPDGTPSGAVDNSQGTSYENLFVRDKYKEFLYTASLSGNGLGKVAIDENGVAQEIAAIRTTGAATSVLVVSDELGYFHDRNEVDITIFNPSTMERTGAIDMSASFRVDGVESITYGVPVIRDDKMFVVAYNNINGSYATDSVLVHVIDVNSNQFEKTIFKNGHVSPLPLRLDPNGDLYIGTQGDISIPNIFKPSFIRIPAGSTEFDDYEFFPISLLPQAPQLLGQLMTRWEFVDQGEVIALCGVTVPPTILEIFAQKPDFTTWTSEDIGNALEALNTEPAAAWLNVDLAGKTVSMVPNLALSAPFTGAFSKRKGTETSFSIQSPTENAVYRYDGQTQTATKIFDIVDGSFYSGLYDLGAEDAGGEF
ncbi:MAG: hypothetical protein AAF616_05465 [Bacteroidota bacterium]